jgi:acetyl-CoA carboxylase biotin carboxyl carrier protein
MDFDELNKILDLVREHELSEFELEREGFKIRIKKGGLVQAAGSAVPVFIPPPVHQSPSAPPLSATVEAATGPEPVAETPPAEEIDLAIVKSPIVGTFFRSSEPGGAPFVEVGDVIKKGQVLCIIEAMKLMNEIDSEFEGELVKVYVDNGQPVQYGERLFAIKAKSDV